MLLGWGKPIGPFAAPYERYFSRVSQDLSTLHRRWIDGQTRHAARRIVHMQDHAASGGSYAPPGLVGTSKGSGRCARSPEVPGELPVLRRSRPWQDHRSGLVAASIGDLLPPSRFGWHLETRRLLRTRRKRIIDTILFQGPSSLPTVATKTLQKKAYAQYARPHLTWSLWKKVVLRDEAARGQRCPAKWRARLRSQ